MKDWKITWRDTADMGLPEHMIGTKYLRYMANEVGAANPDTDWQFVKYLYRVAGLAYGRVDVRSVERSCRTAIEAMRKATGCKAYTVTELVFEMAQTVWERREDQGVPDKEG